MDKNDIRRSYEAESERLKSQIVVRSLKNRVFIGGEVLSFLVAVGFVVLYTILSDAAWTLWTAFLSMAVYFTVRHLDVKNDDAIERLSSLKAVYDNELRYMDGDYSGFGDGEEYADPKHPYTLDLDVFGHASLFQRINRAVTTGGSDALAMRLSSVKWDKDGGKSQKELAGMSRWRAEFIAVAKGVRIDTGAIKRAVENVRGMNIMSFASGSWTWIVAVLSVAGLWVAIFGAVFGHVSTVLPVWWAILQFFVVFMLCSGTLRDIGKAVSRLHGQMVSYTELTGRICACDFSESTNVAIVEELNDAEQAFGKLDKILKAVDRRGNFLWLVIFDALFIMDLWIVRRFLRWQSDYLGHVDGWIDAVSSMDALVSMATFRYNEPSAVDAEVITDEGVVFQARSLRHPFLGDNAVGNDFDIADKHHYIITGANMAGKSTFLRSVGVNYLLAMSGMPVFADYLRVSVFSLFTSMRTTDDLANGISYFNAELLRLQQLLDYCRRQSHTLIILDEILKGTNSLDKLNGSRLFLQYVADMPVTGIVATHDLELSKMSYEHPARFHNHCFEIGLGADVTYSYKITSGVARNQNATYLLRNKVLS